MRTKQFSVNSEVYFEEIVYPCYQNKLTGAKPLDTRGVCRALWFKA